jgi:hypothetical protein
MRLVAVSRLISILAPTFALGACVVDEWTDNPAFGVPAGSQPNPAATATTRAAGTPLVPPDSDASDAEDGEVGNRSAKSDIKAFGGGTIKGTAVFTQHGSDVTVQVDLTSCGEGSHLIQIFGGYSCDSVESQGSVWNPPRGENFGSDAGTMACGADKKGSMTFVRRGGDPNASWTVGDRNPVTDVTRQLIVVFAVDDPSVRHGCGDFL